MRTKDGYLIQPGMWIYNSNGIYEILNIRPTVIEIREVIFDSEDSDEYGYDLPYTILPKELIHYYYV